ncbi:MerR family transcriptional regulator [Streptomyces sp. JNUCC 64]
MAERPSPSAPRPAALSTGAVARRLGVAPTTLRSWDRRYGIGPARHEGDGRHRRWTPDDIAVLDAMCRLTASGVPPAEAARAALATVLPDGPQRSPEAGDPGAPPVASGPPGHRGLARAAARLDAPAVDARLSAALADHGLVTAWEEVMVPALRAVGRAWESSGERYVAVEHLLSWHIATALRRVPAAPPPGTRRGTAPVLLACTPGELHTLPLEALTAGLLERGVPVRMFGAALPAEALVAAVRRAGPSAVVLWSHTRATADRALVRDIAARAWGVRGARRGATVLAAGPGWAGPPPDGAMRTTSLTGALRLLDGASAPG